MTVKAQAEVMVFPLVMAKTEVKSVANKAIGLFFLGNSKIKERKIMKITQQEQQTRSNNTTLNYHYGVVVVPTKDGISEDKVTVMAGIVHRDCLYHSNFIDHHLWFKFNITSHETIEIYHYDSYSELVKAHKEYVGTVKHFNSIINRLKG